MRTYHWISLFKSYIETENYPIESKIIMIANKRVKKSFSLILSLIKNVMS
jgi:hypothetical protein